MKSPILALPILFEVALIVALYTHRNAVAASSPWPTGHVDICDLHRQCDRIAAQLSALEHKPNNFLPRGVTPASSDYPRRNN